MSNINIERGLALTEKYFCIYYVYFSRYIQWLSSRENNILALTEKYFCIYYVYFSRYIQWLSSRENNIFSVLALEMWWDFFSWTVLLNLPALPPSPPPIKIKKCPISARSIFKQPMKRFTHLVNLMLRHRRKTLFWSKRELFVVRKLVWKC